MVPKYNDLPFERSLVRLDQVLLLPAGFLGSIQKPAEQVGRGSHFTFASQEAINGSAHLRRQFLLEIVQYNFDRRFGCRFRNTCFLYDKFTSSSIFDPPFDKLFPEQPLCSCNNETK